MVKHRPPLRSKAWFFQAAARHSRHYCLLGYGSDVREFTSLIIRTAVGLYREKGHFRVPKTLSFKTRLSENKFYMRIKKHFHINGFTLNLALKQRLGATLKWSIVHTEAYQWLDYSDCICGCQLLFCTTDLDQCQAVPAAMTQVGRRKKSVSLKRLPCAGKLLRADQIWFGVSP